MPALQIPQTIPEYRELMAWLDDLKIRTKAGDEFLDAYRWYCLHDLYFLFRYVLLIGRQIHIPFGNPIYEHQLYIDMARHTERNIKYGKGLNMASRRVGKALALDTPILTTGGWKTMESVAEGDYVYDEDGRPTAVIAKSPVFTDKDCYLVDFSNHESIVASGDHEWIVQRKCAGGPVAERVTTEYLSRTWQESRYWIDAPTGTMGQPEDKCAVALLGVTRIGNVPVQCIQVSSPNGLYLAGRGLIPTHNSELRSCAAPIWILLNWPNAAISIISVEKNLATRHQDRIKYELEHNDLLKVIFPDILWENPADEAKNAGIRWSRADGLVIKGRTSNRANASIEVNALFGGGPIGSGYDVIVADDIERSDKVRSREAIKELGTAFSEAVSLLTPYVLPRPVLLISNTSFSSEGLVAQKRDEFEREDPDLVFAIPAEAIEEGQNDKYVYNDDVGPLGGRINYPFTKQFLDDKYSAMADKGEYREQYTLTSRRAEDIYLNTDLVHHYEQTAADIGKDCVTYVTVDPSKGRIDPSAIWVWGLTYDQRCVWLDATISKLDITTQPFHDELFRMVSKWGNLSQRVAEIRVEDTPNSDWANLVEKELRARGCWVPVVKVRVHARIANQKFKSGKADRIYANWAPALNRGEVWFPLPVSKGGKGILCDIDRDGEYVDLVDYMFDTEMRPFPGGKHDDGLDAGGMLWDERTNQTNPLQWPTLASIQKKDDYQTWTQRRTGRTSWMSAG